MSDAHRRWLLSEWQRLFDDIYGSANRASGEVGIAFRMLEEVGEVVKECRSRNSAQLKYHLPDIIAWLCALCSVRELRLTDVVWERYQGGCPSCRSRPCLCMPVPSAALPRVESVRALSKRERKTARSPEDLFAADDRTIGQWEEDLDAIYGARNNSLDWIEIAARVTEHTAAIAKIIRQRQDIVELRRRIADVFAWTLGIWNSVRSYGVTPESSFSDLLFDKYPNWCPKCRQRPCTCPRPITRVFISSGMRTDESRELRDAAYEVLREHRLEPVRFEDFKGQFFFDQEAEAIRRLSECDALLLILESDLTMPVYAEFYAAAAQQIPRWTFLRESLTALPDSLRQLMERIQRDAVYERFRDVEDFKRKLVEKIRKEARA